MILHINPRRQQGRTEESKDEVSQDMAGGTNHPSEAFSKMASGSQGRVVEHRTPKLVREAEKPVTLTPSAFQKEMSLTTRKRLVSKKKLNLPQIVQPQDKPETSHHKFSAVSPDHRSLQPFPPEVVFQNYTPGEVCEMPVVLRNRDQVPQQVKVTWESSPYFQLVGPSGMCHKVPPGLSITIRILFTPWQNKDYFHQLLCITEREEFIVPICAIGARAILDFPGLLDFLECPVKYSSEKTLLVHNLGNRAARYRLSTRSPFSVTPAVGTLGIGDAVQVTVRFQPLQSGDHSASLVVHYDTGENTHISLHGTAVDVHIRLDRDTVTVGKTYITLSNHTTVRIHNLSGITACFQWKVFDTQEEEDQLKLRQYPRLCRQEKDKLSDFLKERRADTTHRERSALLTRTIQSERARVQGDPMLFNSDIFSLEPKEGEIRPNCSAEINVFFKPRAAQVYEQAVYCDISGRETRLPLLLIGEGLGPQLHFSFEELDIGEVFVRAAHSYEAILLNNGPIEASFRLVPPTTAMSSCFTFLPQEGIVAPGRLQAIQISFCPTVLGEFKEEFWFRVTESPKPVTLTIRGFVMGPTFHFNVPALHFGDVSFGFPRTLRCSLSNTSLAPMAFNLCIPEDGLGETSICSSLQICKTTRQSWRKGAQGFMKPREFNISPCRGTIRSLGSQDIEVTLCSNTVREYRLELVVDVDGVGEKVLALTLTARCIVPPLQVLNPVVTFGRCCLKVPYKEKLTLLNDSDLPGCYGVLPQEHKEKAAAWYSSSAPSGIIEAHSSVEIPLTLEAQLLGECSITAEVAMFGSKGSPLEICLECIGQGPVVYVYPRKINFGTIPVLQDSSKSLQLSNQTDIPATFWAEMAGKRSCWRIEPSKGVVPPKSEVSVIVTANLDDTEKFQDKVKVFIENSHIDTIPVQAVGTGSTIVTDKPFAPALNFTPHFSFTPCRYQFKMTNKGRRIHRLYWTTEGFRIFRRNTHPPTLSGTKSKNASQIPRAGSPVFKLRPLQMDLRPGQTVEMVLEGCSSTAQEVKEQLLCHALVGKEKAKKKVMQVNVTCKFICPVVQMSSRAITFRVEKKPSDVLTLQHKPLSLKNTCSLPLSIVLDLEQPFLTCDVNQQPLPADSKPMVLDVGEELHLCIQFNPAYENDLNSWVAERALRVSFMEHPHKEHIPVRGEVHFPNLRLQAKALDFGCVMNDTKQVLYVEMTNCSPLPAQYHWSFQTDSQVNTIRFLPSPPTFKPQSSKKERVFPRRHSKTEGVEEPTEAPEAMQDPAQENPAQQPADAEDSPEAEELSSTAVEPRRLVRMRGLSQLTAVEHLNLEMEEVFNVQPLWGVLPPGQSELVTFSFFGHANIVARVTALCHVEGGPTYEVALAGAASVPSYQLDMEEIDWGLQVFNQVLKAEVTLRNTGVVEFTYVVPNSSTGTAANPLPGVPVVVPSTGSIAPGKEQVLKVYYLPGRPRVFCTTFQVQVGCLEPAEIRLKGEGTFPMITMDLPWMLKGNKKYEKILKEIRHNMEIPIKGSEPSIRNVEQCTDDSDAKKEQCSLSVEDSEEESEEILQEEEENLEEEGQRSESYYLWSSAVMESPMESSRKSSRKLSMKSLMESLMEPSMESFMKSFMEPPMESSLESYKDESGTITWMQMEIEKKLIEDRVLELERAVASCGPKDRVFNKQMRQSLVNMEVSEYILKMGKVPLNESVSHTVTISNPGLLPVSFQADGSVLQDTGFSVDLDQVQGLTYCHSHKFEVHFNSANLPLGEVDVLLPIKVAGGCTVHIHFYATVIDTFSTKCKLPRKKQKSNGSKILRSSQSGTADLASSSEDKEPESSIHSSEDKP
ncbi:hydrocephalus-inducing protein homolog isoform X4 [Aphelocoma coerulescens]|uniref:hydrocephalus-inducing protein homolog isoform X4 n=1 Tax=Aphelocoma coerulescens TaxID=39617 RepID=UPI00360529A3